MQRKDKVKRRLSAQLIDKSTPRGMNKRKVCVCIRACVHVWVCQYWWSTMSTWLKVSVLMPLGNIDILSWDSWVFVGVCVCMFAQMEGNQASMRFLTNGTFIVGTKACSGSCPVNNVALLYNKVFINNSILKKLIICTVVWKAFGPIL